MIKVYFVRHAKPETEGEDRYRPLCAEGMADTALVVRTLGEKKIDAVYCSPYIRSIQTVEGLADSLGLPVNIDERLHERVSGGIWNDREKLVRRWEDHEFHEKNGESIGSVQRRNIAALEDIFAANDGKTVVIGTHGTALSAIFNYYDPSFGLPEFLRIMKWMPYIVECDFEDGKMISKKELAWTDKSDGVSYDNRVTVTALATEEDIKGRAFVHFTSWRETYSGIIGDDYLERVMTQEKCYEIAKRFPDNCLVAKDGGSVVGFVCYGEYRGGGLEGAGEISSIYVLGEYQRRGVGRALMDAALSKLSEFGKVALWVLKDNEKAIDFYKKLGFYPDGAEKEITLGKPLTEIRMILDRASKENND